MQLRRGLILVLLASGLGQLILAAPSGYRGYVAGVGWLVIAYVYAELTRPKGPRA